MQQQHHIRIRSILQRRYQLAYPRQHLSSFTTLTPTQVRELVEDASRRLYIHAPSDWYNVPKAHLKQFDSGKKLLKQYPSVEALVHTIHPDYAWDTERFVITNAKNAPQIYMERVVRGLFPNQEITTNVRATLRVQGDRKAPLEIDVYLPKLKLGFEYQDPHHYFHTYLGTSTLQEYPNKKIPKKTNKQVKTKR